jgi:UDP-N-acetylmuramate: L-alanyl-gamma-D-glutamyl-meso-diaminopimelate ligase
MEALSASDIKSAFANPKLEVFDRLDNMEAFLVSRKWENKNLLMMSSGNFGGLDLSGLCEKIVGR